MTGQSIRRVSLVVMALWGASAAVASAADIRTVSAMGEARLASTASRADAQRLASLDGHVGLIEQVAADAERWPEAQAMHLAPVVLRACLLGLIQTVEEPAVVRHDDETIRVVVEVAAKFEKAKLLRRLDAACRSPRVRAEVTELGQAIGRRREEMFRADRPVPDVSAHLGRVEADELVIRAWIVTGEFGMAQPLARDYAKGFARTALALDQTNAAAHRVLDVLSADAGERDVAPGDKEQAGGRPAPGQTLEQLMDAAEGHQTKGLALFARGDFEGALVAFRAALRLTPDSADIRTAAGRALFALREAESAIAEYRLALRLSPEHLDAHIHLALALNAKGERREAEELFRAVLRANPSYEPAYVGLATIHEANGEREEAIALLRKAVKLQPNDPQAHRLLASLLEATGRPREAVKEWREYVRLTPETPANQENIRKLLGKIRLLEEKKFEQNDRP